MICSLRRKFILIAMPSLLGTMAVLCAAIGVGNYYAATNRMDRAISASKAPEFSILKQLR